MDEKTSRPDEPADPSRRRFLKFAAVGAAAAGIEAALPIAPAAAADNEDLANEYGDKPGMLIDITKCTGCGACVTACKAQNDLAYRDDQPSIGSAAKLASTNYSVVKAFETAGGQRRYVKRQCMHCLEPACGSACFVKALRKTPEGPVQYLGSVCVGCRYCLMACPFSVPTFQWDSSFGRVSKCTECAPRLAQGLPTACADACPTGATTFGKRNDLLAEAHRRIAEGNGKYIDHVYGETEVGGTSVLYLSDVPFEELGFPTTLPNHPIPDYSWRVERLLPPIAAGLAATLVVLKGRQMKQEQWPHGKDHAAEGEEAES